MLRIYDVCLEMVRGVRPMIDAIGTFDRDQARQLRRSAVSVPLNIAEGSGVRGGNRRVRYETALGSARETRANLQVAVAAGYLETLDRALDDQLNHIIGTLVKLVKCKHSP